MLMTTKHKALVIAIDGPAASGKGTIARAVAKQLGLQYLDTGSLYRAVAYRMLVLKIAADNTKQAVHIAQTLTKHDLEQEELSSEEVGTMASLISAIPEVREALIQMQRQVASHPDGAVLDGRDIGTVICPNADFKFYITADLKTRAERRYKQLQNKEKSIIYEDVFEDLQKRDDRDSKRAIAPLKQVKDAFCIDTTHMDASQVLQKVLSIIEGR